MSNQSPLKSPLLSVAQCKLEGSLVFSESDLHREVVDKIQTKVGPYSPPWWYSPHLGTLIAFGRDAAIAYHREIISIGDASFAIDWYPNKPAVGTENLKILFFLPGLGLTSKNKFCKQFVEYMGKSSYFSVVINARGTETPLESTRIWYPGFYGDALQVLENVHRDYPSSKRFLVGYSAGTNVVQKILLNCDQGKKLVHGAMCVCIVQDYRKARNRLEQSVLGRVYSRLMAMIQKDIFLQNPHACSSIGDDGLRRIKNATCLSDYDQAIQTKMLEFSCEDDFNDMMSVRNYDNLEVPLLLIQPSDDPLHQGGAQMNIDVEVYKTNPNIIYFEPKYGNHFGFYEGPLRTAFSNSTSFTYPAKVATEFFETILSREAGRY